MEFHEMAVRHAHRLAPKMFEDDRGCFFEAFRQDELAQVVGRTVPVVQSNYSASRRGALRGLHGTLLPPGQAKVVSCVRGEVLDIVVDIRPGSPTYLVHDTTRLSPENGVSVFVPEGLGHAFLALTEDACVNYLVSSTFVPGTQLDLDALDPQLDLPWRSAGYHGSLLRSPKDAAAVTVEQARRAGLLSSYRDCLAVYADAARAAGR
jgi:NDP-hexose 3,5-(Or5-) epimerase